MTRQPVKKKAKKSPAKKRDEAAILQDIIARCPEKKQLETMPMKTLMLLAKELEQGYSGLSGAAFDIPAIKPTKLSAVFNVRNKRWKKDILASTAWKKAVKALKRPVVGSEEIFGPSPLIKKLDLSAEIAEAILLKVLSAYDDDINGYWSMATVSAAQKTISVGLDTEDGDLFYRLLFDGYLRTRASDAPPYSATILEVGTQMTSPKGNTYEVIASAKAKRWVKR